MSRYLELINIIKHNSETSWATPSQQEILSLLSSHFSSHKVINIFGESGSGKTFLGWLLHISGYGHYISNPDEIHMPIQHRHVIIDNAPSEKFLSRSLRSYLLESNYYAQFVLISTMPVDDDMLKIQLHLTEEDKAKFKQNMYIHCGFQILNDEQHYNLNSLIIANIKEEEQ